MGGNVNPLGQQMNGGQMGGQQSSLGGMQSPGSAMGGQPGMQGSSGNKTLDIFLNYTINKLHF